MGDKNCTKCDPTNCCQNACEQMAKASGPSVVISVIIVFLIPIGVFIASALLCDKFLPAMPGPRHDFKPLVSFVISGAVTMAVLYLVKMINASVCKNKQDLN